ncbi:MAG: tetratricopeptide repeat protein [Melioribacteraceae bacterium]
MIRKTVFLLFIFSGLFAQSNINGLLNRGENSAYNLDFTNAEQLFHKAIELAPESPLGFYHVAQLHIWIYLGSKDPGEYLIFLKYSDMALERIKKALDKDPKDELMLYYLGNLRTLRALAFAMNDSALDAFWEAKNARNSFEEALDINPDFYDAYAGIGVFDYSLTYIPGMFRWAINLTGLSSDPSRGLKYLLTSYKKGKLNKTETTYHLARIYTEYLADYDSASVYLRELLSKYPKNTLFLYQNALTLMRDKELDKAETALNSILRIDNKKLSVVNSLARFRLGEIHFSKNQFQKSINEFKIFLEKSKDFDFVGMANFKIALAYAFIGNKEESNKYLSDAKSGNLDLFEDSYAKNRAEKYENNGFSDDALFVYKMNNYFENGKNSIVYDSLSSKVKDIKDADIRGVALVLLSESCINLKKLPDAVSYAELVSSLELVNEKWVKPYAKYLIGRANFIVGEVKWAPKYLDDAEDLNNYDFKEKIQSQINNIKRKLKN